MARPLKQGLDYFPLNVNLNDDFALIEAEFGLTGFAVIVKLFQKIYGERGYYCEWTKEVALLFSRKVGLGDNVVSEIVGASLRRGIFDMNMFEKYQILTSKGIQKRYFEAAGRRKQIEIKSEYLLVRRAHQAQNVNNNSVNVDINSVNVCNNSQIKGNKIKLNKSKVKESVRSPSQNEIEEVILTYERIRKIRTGNISEVTKRNILIDIGNKVDFEKLFTKVVNSSFLTNWQGCDLNWIVKPDNVRKIMSGKYDDRNKKAEPERKQTSYDINIIEEMARHEFD